MKFFSNNFIKFRDFLKNNFIIQDGDIFYVITDIRRITTLRLTTNCIYEGGPII
jgi:hypothetical protein